MASWKDCLTTGIPVQDGPMPARKDLSDFSDQEMFLYLEGLRRFQSRPVDDPLSYYQIAGIHGMPYTTWPDKTWNKDIKQQGSGGFCTHSSVLFLSWHRPYLSLYESALYAHVNAVADGIDSSYPGKAEYQELAKNFRIPYWDWARKGVSPFPIAAFSSTPYPDNKAFFKSKDFTGPPLAGKPQYNPLFAFPFPENSLQEIKTIQWKDRDTGKVTNREYQSTVRYPDPKGPSTPEKVVDQMLRFFNDQTGWEKQKKHDLRNLPREIERNLSERVAYILRAYQRYGPMSYNAADNNKQILDKVECWGSLEDIHNSVHQLVGNGGHMGGIPRSAFDPIFWLHHTNIDRLFALWQALHEDSGKPDTYVQKTIIPYGTFAKAPDTYEDKDTPLWPFRRTISENLQNDWWTSEQARRTETFGYAYPEIQGWDYSATGADQANNRAQLMRAINKYYSNLPDFISQSKRSIETAGVTLLPQAALLKTIDETHVTANVAEMRRIDQELPTTEVLLTASLADDKPFLRDLAPNNKYLEWLVDIKAEKHAMAGGLQVHVFLGAVEEDNVALWPFSPYHVGTFVTLGQDEQTGCEKCQQDQADHKQVTGQIPLTLALTERYLAQLIPDISEDTVIPYLQQNLHWRVAISNSTVVANRGAVPGLKVVVTSNEVTVSDDPDEPPVYAPTVKVYPEITTKEGGGGRGEGTGVTTDDL